MIKTNAIRILDSKKIAYKIHDYTQSGAISGLDVASFLKEEPKKVFKTLVTIGKSGNHYVFVVPVSSELDLKKGAICVNEKNIEMVKSKDLLPLTGYVHGGCSPVGMKKYFKTVFDKSAGDWDTIFLSGGKIGIQIEISIQELSKVIPFSLEDIKINL